MEKYLQIAKCCAHVILFDGTVAKPGTKQGLCSSGYAEALDQCQPS